MFKIRKLIRLEFYDDRDLFDYNLDIKMIKNKANDRERVS